MTGDRIRKRRKALGLTMEELATKVGYTSPSRKTVIYQWEVDNNKIPTNRILDLSAALETNVYYILGLSDIEDLTDADAVELMEAEVTRRQAE